MLNKSLGHDFEQKLTQMHEKWEIVFPHRTAQLHLSSKNCMFLPSVNQSYGKITMLLHYMNLPKFLKTKHLKSLIVLFAFRCFICKQLMLHFLFGNHNLFYSCK